MSQRKVTLGLKQNSIVTLDYESFDWDRFLAELKRRGLEITNDQAIPCG